MHLNNKRLLASVYSFDRLKVVKQKGGVNPARNFTQ
jgi:hypothetical protein